MSIEITESEGQGKRVTVHQRLFLTSDGERLVDETDPDAASLYSTPGKKIAETDAERFGLVNGKLPGAESAVDDGEPFNAAAVVKGDDLDALTAKQLKEVLDVRGIDYPKSANKTKLTELLEDELDAEADPEAKQDSSHEDKQGKQAENKSR